MTDRRPAPPAHLGGHVAPGSPLAPRAAFAQLPRLVRSLVDYAPLDVWEQETATLPPALQRVRRKMRAFAEQHLAPVALAVDARLHGPPGEPGPEAMAVLRAAAREGLLDDLLPRPFGSADPRLLAEPLYFPAALKTEELAAVDGGLMLLICAHALGAAPLVLSGELGALRRFVLPAFRASARGEPHLFAFAITEPAAGSDVEDGHGAATCRPGTTATRAPGGWRLRGRKCFISGGDLAAGVVVFAALAGEDLRSWTAFFVPAHAPGFRVVRTELKMGMRASGAAELELDEVFVPDDHVVGGLRNGWALNRAVLNMSRIPVAAMGVGFARAATEAALDFCCRTTLGGRPLVDYQDVQLELADMLAGTSAARALVWAAASRPQAVQREASAAKFHCTDTALSVCTRAMDLLGNHALLHHERVEKIYRDARLTQIFEGTNEINRLSVIEDLQEQLLATIAAHSERRTP
jgi:alkylation response protein AidB-like acyl-CoA dehydrogenase